MQIVGATGLAQSGKDTLANWLVRERGFVRIAFADHLKKCAAMLFGFPYEWIADHDYDRVVEPWGKTVRQILQLFGTECMRNGFDQDFWVKHVGQQVEWLQLDPNVDGIVISDVRFNNESRMVQGLGGGVIEIVRPGTKKMSHASEAGVSPEYVTATIHNDGTLEDLYRQFELMFPQQDAA